MNSGGRGKRADTNSWPIRPIQCESLIPTPRGETGRENWGRKKGERERKRVIEERTEEDTERLRRRPYVSNSLNYLLLSRLSFVFVLSHGLFEFHLTMGQVEAQDLRAANCPGCGHSQTVREDVSPPESYFRECSVSSAEVLGISSTCCLMWKPPKFTPESVFPPPLPQSPKCSWLCSAISHKLHACPRLCFKEDTN